MYINVEQALERILEHFQPHGDGYILDVSIDNEIVNVLVTDELAEDIENAYDALQDVIDETTSGDM